MLVARYYFRASLQTVTEWLGSNRCQPLTWIREKLSQKLQGHWNYDGVLGNSKSLRRYFHEVRGLSWRWLNRRSQRPSYRTQGFTAMREAWDLPKLPNPRIVETLYRPAATG